MPFVGEYGPEEEPLYILEDHGHLAAIVGRGEPEVLTPGAAHAFNLPAGGPHGGQLLIFTLDGAGSVASAQLGPIVYSRRQVGPEQGSGQLRVAPTRPVAEALQEALAQAPPAETGPFTPPDLVELITLDRTIKLDIRYATTNNFLGSVFYAQARAFLQRPAAEAVVRAQKALKPLGYGLLVHDGYRPWYVTKTFWDTTPAAKRWLVANPADGSRHNRGAAVDLTLYDLRTGRAIEMPSTYDESTPRAYAFYPGGTSLQRWHRALLRRVMEAEGFTVNPNEWWHFDFNNWKNYAIGNVAFDKIR
jgi:D-alanyl-D-alanine dipeptidase